jgi:hypothetical protein
MDASKGVLANALARHYELVLRDLLLGCNGGNREDQEEQRKQAKPLQSTRLP